MIWFFKYNQPYIVTNVCFHHDCESQQKVVHKVCLIVIGLNIKEALLEFRIVEWRWYWILISLNECRWTLSVLLWAEVDDNCWIHVVGPWHPKRVLMMWGMLEPRKVCFPVKMFGNNKAPKITSTWLGLWKVGSARLNCCLYEQHLVIQWYKGGRLLSYFK